MAENTEITEEIAEIIAELCEEHEIEGDYWDTHSAGHEMGQVVCWALTRERGYVYKYSDNAETRYWHTAAEPTAEDLAEAALETLRPTSEEE